MESGQNNNIVENNDESASVTLIEVNTSSSKDYSPVTIRSLIFGVLGCIASCRLITFGFILYIINNSLNTGSFSIAQLWPILAVVYSLIISILFYWKMHVQDDRIESEQIQMNRESNNQENGELMQSNNEDETDGPITDRMEKLMKSGLKISQSIIFPYSKAIYYYFKIYFNKEPENRNKYYHIATNSDADDSLVNLVGNFVTSCPQRILQLSIILGNISNFFDNWTRNIYVMFSIGLMIYSLTTHQKKNRECQNDKDKMTFKHITVVFFFNFLFLGVRLMCIALLFSINNNIITGGTIFSCLLHIILSISWLCCFERPHFADQSNPKTFNIAYGCIYLFTFLQTTEDASKKRFTYYYTIFIIENVFALVIFYFFSTEIQRVELKICILIPILVVCNIIGIFILILYYCYVHPNPIVREKNSKDLLDSIRRIMICNYNYSTYNTVPQIE